MISDPSYDKRCGTVREGAPGPKSISGDINCLVVTLEAVEKS